METIGLKYLGRNDLEWLSSKDFVLLIDLYRLLIQIQGLEVKGRLYDQNLMLYLKGDKDELKRGIELVLSSQATPTKIDAPIGSIGSTERGFRIFQDELSKSESKIKKNKYNLFLGKILNLITFGLYTPEFEIETFVPD